GVEAVLLDYGRTLVTFEYPKGRLLEVIERFRPAISEAIGVPAPQAEQIMEDVLLPLEAGIESPDGDEVRYVDVHSGAGSRVGAGGASPRARCIGRRSKRGASRPSEPCSSATARGRTTKGHGRWECVRSSARPTPPSPRRTGSPRSPR